MRRLSLAFAGMALCVLSVGCGDVLEPAPIDEHWSFEGLSGNEVYELAQEGDLLYAATRNGLYVRSMVDDAAWEQTGFEGQRVNDVLPLGNGALLVAIDITGEEGDTLSLYRSSDGGVTWEPSQEGFGMGESTNEARALARVPGTSTIFASGQAIVVARSTDLGRTWEAVWGDWDGFGLGTHTVTVHPEEQERIWAGGEAAAFVPFLVHSADGGETWDEYYPDLGGDNATNRIALHPENAELMLAGMEGTLMRSADGGESWDFVLEPERYPYFFGVAFSNEYADRAFAGGVENHDNPQPLVLYVSEDGGETWDEVRQDAAEFGGIFDILPVGLFEEEVLFVATQEGVYRYDPNPTS